MTLSADQVKKIWIVEQEVSNPRYQLMSSTEKEILNNQLSTYYDQNQSTFLTKYTTNFFETSVSTSITDDSERVPFSVQQHQRIASTGIQSDEVPLIDSANNRILWMDSNLTILKEIWIYDTDPKLANANLIQKIDKDFLNSPQGTNDPIGLAELYYYGQFITIQATPTLIYWIPIKDPLTFYYHFTRTSAGFWTHLRGTAVYSEPTYLELIDGFSDLLFQLNQGSLDPLHPENINSNWNLLNASHLEPINPGDIFKNQGGPIISDCHLYVLFMGDTWQSDPKRTALLQFHTDLFDSDFMNILKQYGINSGIVSGNLTFTGIPSIVSDRNMQSLLMSAIAAGKLPPPDEHTFYFGYLDQTISIAPDSNYQRKLSYSATGAAGYHDSFKFNDSLGKIRYGFSSYNNNLNIMTIIGSHEIAEGLTDPEYTAWTPDHGMTEIADVCEGQFGTITVGSNIWTIQKTWSHAQRSCQLISGTAITDPDPGAVIKNFGGAVVANSKMYLIFMGNNWTNSSFINHPDDVSNINGLLEFTGNLCNSSISPHMNILRQYGILNGMISGIPIYINVFGALTLGNIQSALQNAINSSILPEPDGSNIYIIFLDDSITITPLGGDWIKPHISRGGCSFYHDKFITTGGHSCRYGLINYGIAFKELTPPTSGAFAEIVTNPDGNGWHSNDGQGVATICNYHTQEVKWQPGTLSEKDYWVYNLWSSHHNYCLYSLYIPEIDPSPGPLYNHYIWGINEITVLGKGTMNLITDSVLNDQGTKIYSAATDFPKADYNYWYNKYIMPVRNNDQTVITPVKTEPIINLVVPENGIVIRKSDTSAVIEISQKGVIYYEVWFFDKKEWGLVTTLDHLPNEEEVNTLILYRPQIFNLDNRIITWNGSLVESISVKSPQRFLRDSYALEPDMFSPGRYLLMKITDEHWLWFDKMKPWNWQHKTVDITQLNLRELFFRDYYIFLSDSGFVQDFNDRPTSLEANNPSLINPNWSAVGTSDPNVKIWGTGWSDYLFVCKLTPWLDLNGKSGTFPILIGYQHRDLDSMVKMVSCEPGSMIGTYSGPSINYSKIIGEYYNKNYYFQTYTTGGSIQAEFVQYNNTIPLLCGDGKGYMHISEILNAYPGFEIVNETLLDLRIGNKEYINNWIVEFYFEYLDYVRWAKDSTSTWIYGGWFMTKMYIMEFN